jgi:hypothetical protein
MNHKADADASILMIIGSILIGEYFWSTRPLKKDNLTDEVSLVSRVGYG